MAKTTRIAVVTSPGLTHLVPILEFSKRFLELHPNFHVTCMIPSLGPHPDSTKSYLQTLPSNIHSILLPPINKQDLPQGAYPGVLIQKTVTLSLPSIRDTLKSLTLREPLAALIADAYAFEALSFAKEFNFLSYIYFPSSVMALSLCLHLPKLDEQVTGEYKDLKDPIYLPGCVPVFGRDLPFPMQNRSSDVYKLYLERSKGLNNVNEFIINSFLELESAAMKELAKEKSCFSFYAVGPITQKRSSSNDGDEELECLRWLDKQPHSSVLYVSFGSGGTLSQSAINELALGLELSGQRFLWVLRAPSDSSSSAYLDNQKKEDPLKFLPSGFLERTKEKGLVLPSWAPQVQILSHDSVGGFLSHCGWNSVLESVQVGVPIITWPLFAEQRMNAVLLVDGLKVAVRPNVGEDGVVEKEEVSKVIKCLMEQEEGKAMRKRMEDLKAYAADAVNKDAGSSTHALSQLATKWENFSGIEDNN
ncbi:hydroquinone glucosyltransferase-like [Arachis stenosperma]|uniref:hydroquinone glucosyltransferase-like n=1 Tax=Arachis stenosperma TaxID=217475 RepID=UPI0025AC70D1|nr:hydroquinone glucosyltransferase-like [Arachis stenosperma]